MRWPIFRHVERRATRMHDMIERVRVDPVKLARMRHGEAYAEARTNCLHCAHADDCLHWLATTEIAVEPPPYCPNSELFETCKRSS